MPLGLGNPWKWDISSGSLSAAALGGGASLTSLELLAKYSASGVVLDDLDITKTWGPDTVGLLYKDQSITPLGADGETVAVALDRSQASAYPTTWTAHNLARHTEDLTNAAYTDQGTPIRTATTVEDDNGASTEGINQAITTVAGIAYVWTVDVGKDAITSRFPALGITDGTTYVVQINTSTGAIVDEGAALSASTTVEDAGSYWRVRLKWTAAGTTGTLLLRPARASIFGTPAAGAVGVASFLHLQVNRGVTPTAYIAQTTAGGFIQTIHLRQSVSGSRPVWKAAGSGLPPYLNHDGIDDNLLSTFNPATEGMIAAYFRATSSDIIIGAAGASNSRCFLSLNADGKVSGGIGAESFSTIASGGSDRAGADVFAALIWNGTTVTLVEDTGIAYQAAQSGTPTTSVPFRFGGNNANGTAASFTTGRLYKGMVQNKAPTVADVLALRRSWLS